MADALRKWIVTDLESAISTKEPFEWNSSARRVQIISFESFSTNDDPAAHWSAWISDKHCAIEAVLTRACVEKFLANGVKPTSLRGAILTLLDWKFQKSNGESSFIVLINYMVLIGSVGSSAFGDPISINSIISSSSNEVWKYVGDLKSQEDAPENMELLIEELEKKEWEGLQLSYKDFFPSVEQRSLLEGLFPIKRHLPRQLQLALKPSNDQNEDETQVSDFENNLGFELLSDSIASLSDQENITTKNKVDSSLKEASDLKFPTRTQGHDSPKVSPSRTDSIFSEFDIEFASQASYPKYENYMSSQLIMSYQEIISLKPSGEDSHSIHDSDCLVADLKMQLMTQQMEHISSSNDELDSNDNQSLDGLSPYSKTQRQHGTTQAFDVESCSSLKESITSEIFADSPPFNLEDAKVSDYVNSVTYEKNNSMELKIITDPLLLSPECRSISSNPRTQMFYDNSFNDSKKEHSSYMERSLLEPETQPQENLQKQLSTDTQDNELPKIGLNIIEEKNGDNTTSKWSPSYQSMSLSSKLFSVDPINLHDLESDVTYADSIDSIDSDLESVIIPTPRKETVPIQTLVEMTYENIEFSNTESPHLNETINCNHTEEEVACALTMPLDVSPRITAEDCDMQNNSLNDPSIGEIAGGPTMPLDVSHRITAEAIEDCDAQNNSLNDPKIEEIAVALTDEAVLDSVSPTNLAKILQPIKNLINFFTSPFTSPFKNSCERTESRVISNEWDGLDKEHIVSTMSRSDENLIVTTDNLANDPLTSELDFTERMLEEFINDSQEVELNYKESRKPLKPAARSLSGTSLSIWHSNKPKISLKYYPRDPSNFNGFSDFIDSKKRRRLM